MRIGTVWRGTGLALAACIGTASYANMRWVSEINNQSALTVSFYDSQRDESQALWVNAGFGAFRMDIKQGTPWFVPSMNNIWMGGYRIPWENDTGSSFVVVVGDKRVTHDLREVDNRIQDTRRKGDEAPETVILKSAVGSGDVFYTLTVKATGDISLSEGARH